MKQKETELFQQLDEQDRKFKAQEAAGQVHLGKTVSKKTATSVGNANDVSSISDAMHMTADWVQTGVQQGHMRADRVDSRSLPDPELMKHRRDDLDKMQQHVNKAAEQHRQNKAASTRTQGNTGKSTGRKYGEDHLNQLGLFSDHDMLGLQGKDKGPGGPPPPQSKPALEWEQARSKLDWPGVRYKDPWGVQAADRYWEEALKSDSGGKGTVSCTQVPNMSNTSNLQSLADQTHPLY